MLTVILAIGREILRGRVQDTNSWTLARRLTAERMPKGSRTSEEAARYTAHGQQSTDVVPGDYWATVARWQANGYVARFSKYLVQDLDCVPGRGPATGPGCRVEDVGQSIVRKVAVPIRAGVPARSRRDGWARVAVRHAAGDRYVARLTAAELYGELGRQIEQIIANISLNTATVIAGDFNSLATFAAPKYLLARGLCDSFASVTPQPESHPTWRWPTRRGRSSSLETTGTRAVFEGGCSRR